MSLPVESNVCCALTCMQHIEIQCVGHVGRVTVFSYPCFRAHLSVALHIYGVCGGQVERAHTGPSGTQPVHKSHVLRLNEEKTTAINTLGEVQLAAEPSD